MPKKANASRKGYKPPPPPALKREPSVGEVDTKTAAGAVAEADEFGAGTYSQRLRKALELALTLADGGGIPVRVLWDVIAQYSSNVQPLRMVQVGGTRGVAGWRDATHSVLDFTRADTGTSTGTGPGTGTGSGSFFHAPQHCVVWRNAWPFPATPKTDRDVVLIADSRNNRMRLITLNQSMDSAASLLAGDDINATDDIKYFVSTVLKSFTVHPTPCRDGHGMCVSTDGQYVYWTEREHGRVCSYDGRTGSNQFLESNRGANEWKEPQGLCCSRDDTLLYVADTGHNMIKTIEREVTPHRHTHHTQTIAGNGNAESVDGMATTKGALHTPTAVALDWSQLHGLFIATATGIRRYSAISGELTTVKSTLTGVVSNIIVVEASKLLAAHKESLYIVDVTTGETSLVGVSNGTGFGSAFKRPVGLALVNSGDVSDSANGGAGGVDQLFVVDTDAHAVYFLSGSILNARL